MRLFKKMTLLTVALLLSTGVFAQSALKKANKQYELKAYELAIKSYQKFLKKKPTNVVALNRIADSYRHLNKMEDAAKYYKQAVKNSRVDKEAHLNYGKVLMALGNHTEASGSFSKYADTDPVAAKKYKNSVGFAYKNRNNPTTADINNEFINTSGDDFAAIPFNNRVVFASTRQDLKRANDKNSKKNFAGGNPNQLFITDRDNSGFLRTPAFLHSDLKNKYNQGPVSYSPDGKWVAFTSNNFIEGTRHLPSDGVEMGIYIAAVEGSADFSEAVAFPYNGNGFSTGYPVWADDGKTLYFASDRPDGFGGFDIYVSRKTGVSWTPPQNLGSVINSKGNEISPFHDGASLYFSSDWHDGLGGYDIFRAEKSGKRYTNIYHAGTGINSSYDDLSYTYDVKNNLGYITSNRPGGKGGYDIYRIKHKTVRMVVSVMDENSRPIKDATIDFTDCGEGVFLTDVNGLYSFQVKPGLTCTPLIRKAGYRTTSFNLVSGAATTKKIVLKRGSGSDVATGGNNGGSTRPGNNGGNNNGGSQTGGNTNTRPAGDFLGFNGRVVDERNGVGLPNVVIRARRQSDGMLMEATSDSNGNYIIGLNPNTTYSIDYSKSGFFPINRSVRTGNSNDSSILGTSKIKSTSDGYVGNNNGGGTYPSGGNTGGNTSGNNNGGETYPSGGNTGGNYPSGGNTGGNTGGNYPSGGNTGGNYPSGGNTSVSSGYAVQVAAVSASNSANLSKFSSLSDLGTVYYTPVGNVYKIRIGVYATADEARAIATRIKARGYDGAFMVTEGNVNVGTASTSPQTNNGGYNGGANTSNSLGSYVVRLGAYSNPQKSFDRDSVLDIGQIAEQYKGQFTIILLTGYNSLGDAQRALAKAKQRGFRDAYIAQDVNGVLQKVKF